MRLLQSTLVILTVQSASVTEPAVAFGPALGVSTQSDTSGIAVLSMCSSSSRGGRPIPIVSMCPTSSNSGK
jgi:hypothetical protein